jgi:hypothetical protein
MKVRLTRKLAEQLDGVDVSPYEVGDILDVSQREAELLIAEGWARPHEARGAAFRHQRAAAAERARKRRKRR